MADEEIAIKLVLEADSANLTLKELEDGFEAMNAELKETGRGTERFKELSTAMAQTSVEIQNVESAFEGLDSNAVAGEMGALAGGIGDVTASLVLMGGENETIQQIAASIETALAISMGFKGAIEGVSAATKIYTDLQNKGKIATIAKTVVEKVAAAGTWILNAANKALNTTLKMNPIGLIVIAITAVVGAIVYFKDSIMDLIDIALKPFQWAIDTVVDALQWLGIMESDSAIATRKAEKEKSDAAIESARKRIKETEKLIAAHKKMTDSITADMDWEIRKRKANGEDTTEIEIKKLEHLILAAKEEQKLQKRRREDMEREIELRIKSGDATMKQVMELLEVDLDSAEKSKKAREAQLQSEKDLEIALIELKKESRDKRKAIKREEIKEQEKAAVDEKNKNEKAAADEKKINEKAAADKIALEKDAQAKKDEYDKLLFDAKLANEQEETERQRQQLEEDFQNNLATLEEQGLLTMELEIELLYAQEQALADIKEQFREEERQAKFETAQIAMDLAASTLAEISGVAGAYADRDLKAEEERFNKLRATKQLTEKQLAAEELKTSKIKDAIRKRQFENEKKMQIATATINGAQAFTSIWAQYPKWDGGFAMIAALAGAAITTASTIAKIKSTKFNSTPSAALPTLPSGDSPDGAGGGGGGVQLSPVSNTSTILGNQQVFVTETDITDTQNNVSVIEESATF
tara:strand:+ start:80 stop:2176 length:2097 start_codon:yes stop_codon:yes gene_type:complete